MPVNMREAVIDPGLRAVVLSRTPLRYAEGAHLPSDRPAHVRAGSGLTWIGERLALIQDDANFVALIDPVSLLVSAVALPAGEGGLRQFDDVRGNKKFKLDLEACTTLPDPAGPVLLAFGSGSKRRRRCVAAIDRWNEPIPHVTVVDATALYEELEAEASFAGSDMNIEGALFLVDRVRLFGRGNGAFKGDGRPLNATCDLHLAALRAYLAEPERQAVPRPQSVVQYSLGTLEGITLGFTDATVLDQHVLYAAAAEASADAASDGEVSGSVLGVIPPAGTLRQALLVDAAGTAVRVKIEGVARSRTHADRVYVVIDGDDPARASELCEVQLVGAWL